MSDHVEVSVHIEEWEYSIPFRITGQTYRCVDVMVVEITSGLNVGRGEALPIHYIGDDIEKAMRQVESLASEVDRGLQRKDLLKVLPGGAARNALDSALWDLEAKQSGQRAWSLAGLEVRPVDTFCSIGIEATPEAMGARASELADFPRLKIKLDSDQPVERMQAIRAARPDARLMVDANQGWTIDLLEKVTPELAALGVEVIEQPLPRGEDEALEDFASPIPLCADESCQDATELEQVARRYQVVNIKLDKVGGLTAALSLVSAARQRGLKTWVGNMGGTSLSMAPAFVLAQLCDFAELDGAVLLRHDRPQHMVCNGGRLEPPTAALWG